MGISEGWYMVLGISDTVPSTMELSLIMELSATVSTTVVVSAIVVGLSNKFTMGVFPSALAISRGDISNLSFLWGSALCLRSNLAISIDPVAATICRGVLS